MSKLRRVEVSTLGAFLSTTPSLTLPWFQRAYSWPSSQVARLLGDLLAAMRTGGEEAELLLGTLMLAERSDGPGLALVDGHQRMMTTALLLCVLRDLEPDAARRAAIDRVIADPDIRPRKTRLEAPIGVASFLEAYVFVDGATESVPEDGDDEFSESECKVIEARDVIASRVEDGHLTADERRALADFVLNRCRVILHVYADTEAAWREVRISEDTHVPFNAAAQAKATLLAVLPVNERQEAARVWEDCEQRLGAEAMVELLVQIRTLRLRRRSDKPVETDLREIFALDRGGATFIDGWLRPHASTFHALRLAGKGAGPLPDAIRTPVERMSLIDTWVWGPAALRWLEVHGEAHASTALFFRRLDRLVWAMRIAGVDAPIQRNRIIALVQGIDAHLGPDAIVPLAIDAELKADMLAGLRAQNFCLKAHAARVLRLVSIALGSDPGPVDKNEVTIEHVLPRNPLKNRKWWQHFPTKDVVKANVNRLGNLTFLSQEENQAAETRDWDDKRPILARSAHVLSQRAAQIETWDRSAIRGRTEDMIKSLFDFWEVRP